MPWAPDSLTISIEQPDSEVARGLIVSLDADLLQRYPKSAIHGFHQHDLKRMFVTPEF